MKNTKTGFTLIELLIVIAIIGFLASAAMYAVNSARIKARDAQRVADLNQVRKALEMYYDKHEGVYPLAANYALRNSYTAPGNWIPELVAEGFIVKLPNDPLNNGNYPWEPNNNYSYSYTSFDGKDYNLVTKLEDPTNPYRCAAKCYKFNADSAGRVGKSWCLGSPVSCGAGSQNFNPKLYSDH